MTLKQVAVLWFRFSCGWAFICIVMGTAFLILTRPLARLLATGLDLAKTGALIMIASGAVAMVTPAEAGQYRFAVKGEQVLLNDTAFKLIGLRVSNALISDETTEQLLRNLDAFKDYGVNTVSVYLMGSRFGDIKGYKPDASLDPVYAT